MRKQAIAAAILVLFFAINVHAQKRILKGFAASDSPLAVSKIEAGKSRVAEANYVDIFVKNVSSKTVSSYLLKVIYYNPVNIHDHTVNGVFYGNDLRSGIEQKSVLRYRPWDSSINDDESHHYHIFIVPERVVFMDGTVWQRKDDAPYNEILALMHDGTDLSKLLQGYPEWLTDDVRTLAR